jgi:hypothetical protein
MRAYKPVERFIEMMLWRTDRFAITANVRRRNTRKSQEGRDSEGPPSAEN